VTVERFVVAMVLFHAAVGGIAWMMVRRWEPSRCALPGPRWWGALLRDITIATLATYGTSVAAPFLANLDDARRMHIGEISLRLLGQALFGEGVLLAVGLCWTHRRARRPARSVQFGAVAAGLLAVYVEAYHLEPHMLKVRRHKVEAAAGYANPRMIRILHVTDIQTPAIGAHEERALRAGLAERPDLIVLTGDYVQDALGRPTEDQAAADLRRLIAHIGFDAPLGVFATEGDVGPPCREVFAGTGVRCLVDASAVVALPDGGTLGITGLSGGRGRERDPAWLAWLLSRGPGADHRIVISHSPDFVDAMPVDVDLVLAGHTHGGQVVLPFVGPLTTASRLPHRYAGGLHDYEGTPLHVSRGVGMERGFAPPVRFLCPPEICVLEMSLASRDIVSSNSFRNALSVPLSIRSGTGNRNQNNLSNR
jgi:predicted MPP superfamily phosphohydrolase